ncbi:MAG TPA: hypothetical protein VJ622_11670 [Acidimicrobiia bacterium]|nr:hypothetical protein [Acidimicrobiia bacterium]HMC37220.1 hypothetical protein [Actinomycetota bacterium]
MKYVILAHGGHVVMLIMPVVAIAYLALALRGERTKGSNPGTPRLPTSPFGRQVHAATTPPKEAKKAASPVPPTFMPSRAGKHTTGPIGVPRHLQPTPKAGSGPSSSSGQASMP